jgi:ABC-type multidrug transport system fused ATPase/permease subunit
MTQFHKILEDISFAEIRRSAAVFAKDLFRWHTKTLMVMYLISLVTTVLEGFAISMIIPIFSLIGVETGEGTNAVTEALTQAYAYFGLELNFATVVMTVLLVTVLQHAIALLGTWIGGGFGIEYSVRMRNYVLSSVLGARWSFFLNTRQGDLIDVYLTEMDRAGGLVGGLNSIINLTLTALIYSTIAFLISWKITLVLLVCAALIGIAVQLIQRTPWRHAQEVSDASGDLTSGIGELIAGIKLVLIAGSRERALAMMSRNARRLSVLGRRLAMIPAYARAAFEILAVGLLCAALYVSFVVFKVAISDLLIILAVFFRLLPRMSVLATAVSGFVMNVPFFRRVMLLCDAARRERETVPENAIDIGSEPGAAAIRFGHVDLGYGDRRVLNDIDLTIRPNEIVGVAGASGVGKSTLVDAIAGLLEPQVGRIFVNDHPMDTLHLERWRQSIGYVTQDTYLLNGTLLENIALGDSDVGPAEVIQAIREVGLMDMVDDLPNGLDTDIGPGGIGLSGGQRQRVGIARALVGHKKLIIFDEPTSALDAHLERLITDLIAELCRRTTVVVIAHRLSTLRVTNRILVLKSGRLVEDGPWRELSVRPGGVFQHMWMQQMVSDGERVKAAQ